jgi:branched-chain amino acid transport system substrate-binding protein
MKMCWCLSSKWKKSVTRWARAATYALVIGALFGCTSVSPLPPLPDHVGAGDAGSSGVVRVGVLLPMTGELATFGELARNGVRLALDEWNEAGGVGGERVAWELADTACDAATARQAAEELISGGVELLVGGVCSESAIPIANVAQEKGALFIAIAATHPLVTVTGDGATRPTVFRAAYAYSYQADAAARFLLEEQGVAQAAVVFDPRDVYAAALGEAFERRMVDGGGDVAYVPSGFPDEIDWSEVWNALDAAKPAALYLPGDSQFAQALSAPEGFSSVIGSDAWRSAEGELGGLEGAFFTDHFDADIPTAAVFSWSRRYEDAFAQQPETLAVAGYEAVHMLSLALDKAADPTPAAVAGELETMEIDGVLGVWRFDAHHNPVKDVVVLQVRGRTGVFFSLLSP